MKNIIKAITLLVTIASTATFAEVQFEYIEGLDKNRDGIEYAAKIYELEKTINSHKWDNGDNKGFIVSIEKNEQRSSGSDQIWATIEHFIYDSSTNEAKYEVIQSPRKGFVQFTNLENAQNVYHIRAIDNDTLEVVQDPRESDPSKVMTWKKTDEFTKRDGGKKLKSGRERGTFF